MVGQFIVPPRLRRDGQIAQGDLFARLPLRKPLARQETAIRWTPALLLTPTCDYAIKESGPERQAVLLEPLAENDPRLARWQDDALPLHVAPVPALAGLLPHGGLAHFRALSGVHASDLAGAGRIATLDATGLRRLLAGLTTYFTRAAIDPAQIALPPSDPRLLWDALDRAAGLVSLKLRLDALEQARAIALRAVAQHHGLAWPTLEATEARLAQIAATPLLPETSRRVITGLAAGKAHLALLHRIAPAQLPRHRQVLDAVMAEFVAVGDLLQEEIPLQLTKPELRRFDLGHLAD